MPSHEATKPGFSFCVSFALWYFRVQLSRKSNSLTTKLLIHFQVRCPKRCPSLGLLFMFILCYRGMVEVGTG